MSNLATITNNILADSGIDDINVIVSTGSYANPAWITSLAWTKITGVPANIVTGTGTTNVVPKFTGTSTIGDSAISDNTNEVSIIKRLFLNTGGQSILLTPNLGSSVNRIESSNLPLEITTLGSALRLAAGGVTAQLTLASTGVVTLTNLAGTGSRIVTADSSGNLSASSALSGYVQGSGTTNYLPKFTGASTIGNSVIQEASSNIGIGVSPLRKLHVLSGTGIAQFQSTTSAGDIYLGDASSSSIDNQGIGSRGNNIVISAGGLERVTLTSAGNLGLGVTPSTGGLAGYVLFELANGGASIYSGPNQNLNGTNISWSGGTASYKISNFATVYNQQSGQHQWYTAPSGTAGNAITFTQAMTLTSGGNLLVGTGSDNGARLQVSGTATVSQLTSLSASGSAAILLKDSSANNKWEIGHVSNSLYFYNYTTGTNPLVITGATGAATFSSSAFNVATFNSTFGQMAISFANNGTTFSQIGSGVSVCSTAAADDLGFGTAGLNKNIVFATGTGFTERMRITSGGNVGIGTTSPNGKLRIQNDNSTIPSLIVRDGGTPTANLIEATSNAYGNSFIVTATGNVGIGTANATGQSSDNRVIQIYGAGVANRAQIHFVNVNTGETATDGSFIGIDSNSELFIINRENAATVFENNGGESMRITAGRNVLIGTTTDVGAKLQVSGAGTFSGSVTINNASIYNRVFSDILPSNDAQGVIYVREGNVSGADGLRYASRTHLFQSHTGSNYLAITSSGNVLIGTTTDVGARLYVDGAFRTGTLTAGTQTAAVDWRLGNARGGTATANALIRVQINGVLVDLIGNYV